MDNTPFFTAVDSLIRISEDNQHNLDHYRSAMYRGQWLRDVATVQLTVPRQLGKTSYILKRANCADLIIVHNHAMKRQYEGTRAQVIAAHEVDRFLRYTGVKQRFNRVYIDEPRLVFTNGFTSDNLYSYFCGECGSNACTNTVIMLGT